MADEDGIDGDLSPIAEDDRRKRGQVLLLSSGRQSLAMLRAFVGNIIHMRRTSGASTITMQVARSLEPKRRTYWNKLVEVFRAFQLEWKYSKDQILQLYLNKVPYGGNIQGVKSASILYFKKIQIIFRWRRSRRCRSFPTGLRRW
jgi:hypothetical protein